MESKCKLSGCIYIHILFHMVPFSLFQLITYTVQNELFYFVSFTWIFTEIFIFTWTANTMPSRRRHPDSVALHVKRSFDYFCILPPNWYCIFLRYLLVLPSWPHSCFTKNICDFRYQAVAEAGKGWQESQSLQGKFFSSLFLVNILKITENLT
jgi:hypothetical protein